jgi:hypothetical protein
MVGIRRRSWLQRHTRLTTRNDYDCDLLVDVRVEISLRQMVYTESD